MPIEHLGPYRIERLLGHGGMGTVYAGVHRETGEPAAIKVLAESLAADSRFRERFQGEVETLKRLRHENIVTLQGYGEEDGGCSSSWIWSTAPAWKPSCEPAGGSPGARSWTSASRFARH